MRVETYVDSYPDHAFIGEVAKKLPSVDPRSRTFKMEVVISNMNRERFLTEGMFCRVDIVLSEKLGVAAVPEKALMKSSDGFMVFLIDKGKAQKRLVHVGIKEKGLVEIEKGLEIGMQVITGGNFGLKEGVRVNVMTEDKGGSK
jgi:membrane fusion protein (multidrug efflux system)